MRTSGNRALLLFAAIGLAACSSQESSLVKTGGDGQQSATVFANHQQQISLLRRKIVTQLEKKNYRQALELLHNKNREGLEREYLLAVNGLLELGTDAYAAGDYAAAARNFKVVINAYPLEPSLKERISHDPKRIRAILDVCSNRLMEQGLEEYRRGSLESAINKWKILLAIRPGHQEAKKALETATVQLQTLQSMKDK